MLASCWQVLTVVGTSASLQDDAHSLRVAAATLSAMAPAWLSAGRPPAALTAAVIDAAPSMPQHRRVALLSALLEVLPPVCTRVASAVP